MSEDRVKHRGFGSMDPVKQRELASKGGKAAHAKGVAHEWSPEEAREAGRKGGQASRGGRGRLAAKEESTNPSLDLHDAIFRDRFHGEIGGSD